MTTTSDPTGPSRTRHPSRLPHPSNVHPPTKEHTMTDILRQAMRDLDAADNAAAARKIDPTLPDTLTTAIIAADTAPPTDCPRCGGGIPNDLHRGQYPGALSRWDNDTMICSGCGTDEAMTQLQTHGTRADRMEAIHPTHGTTRWAIFTGRSSSPDTE